MRGVVQRVIRSSVRVGDEVVGEIGKGLNLLLGVKKGDTRKDMKWLADKVVNLRIFEDNEGKMNLSLLDIEGEILVISQFTLLGDCRKGRRPSFFEAARPEEANGLYEAFVEYIGEEYGINVETGTFQEHMDVDIQNDGPVTLLVDSNKEF